MYEMRLEQAQEPIKQKFNEEIYKELLRTVIREHLQNINEELTGLYNDILKRVELSQTAIKELNNITLTGTTDIYEKIKDALWS